jgi:uncharacterized protein RhaS with RHS repeats
MNRKMVALVLAGAMIAVPIVLAWDMTDTDSDVGSHGYVRADATVRANFNEYLRVTAYTRYAGGSWYSSHPSGWTLDESISYGGGIGSTFVSAACSVRAIDENNHQRDYASASARVP